MTLIIHTVIIVSYAFAIPVPHDRTEVDNISIEHYFTDSEIKTSVNGKRLFMGNEFYTTGAYKGNDDYYYPGHISKVIDTIKIIEHETNRYVTDKTGREDYSISKAYFVDNVCDGNGDFANISFEEFRKIFTIIQEICEDAQNPVVEPDVAH